MVVAAGAAERQPEKRLAKGVDAVVDVVRLVLLDVDGRVDLLAQEPEARADDRLVGSGAAVEPRPREQVAGDLLANELVVREVGVERPDDPVPVLERIGNLVVELVPARLRIADHVEPVPGESLPVVGRGEQRVDVAVESQRIGVVDHAFDVPRVRRPPREHLGDPADEHRAVRFRGGFEVRRLEPGEHVSVDVAATPTGLPNRGGRRGDGTLPAPMSRAAFSDVEGGRLGLRGSGVVRPGHAPPHPVLDRLDRLGREPAGGRHLEVAVVPHDLHQQAFVGPAGDGHARGRQKIGP